MNEASSRVGHLPPGCGYSFKHQLPEMALRMERRLEPPDSDIFTPFVCTGVPSTVVQLTRRSSLGA